MANKLNFQNAKKKFLTLEMVDGKVILVCMPNKKTFDYMMSMKDNIDSLTTAGGEAVDALYDLAADLMSNNLSKEKITSEYVAESLDIEDIVNLYTAYMEFMSGGTNSPN